MPDKLIEQYQKDKTKLDMFFEWLNNFPVVLRLIIIMFIIFMASGFGYLIGLLIKIWR